MLIVAAIVIVSYFGAEITIKKQLEVYSSLKISLQLYLGLWEHGLLLYIQML